jgi:hypothetical protein
LETMALIRNAGVPWNKVFLPSVRNAQLLAFDVYLTYTPQNFPTTAVDHLSAPFGYLTWHGVNMAEGLKAGPAAYRFTHNQSGLHIRHDPL